MSLEGSLKSALSSVAGGRIYPDVTPDNVTFPCVVYQQVGGNVIEPLEGTMPDKEHARMQIWVWSTSRLTTSATMREVRAALVAAWAANTYSAPISHYDDVLKLYGARCDFGIWYTP